MRSADVLVSEATDKLEVTIDLRLAFRYVTSGV